MHRDGYSDLQYAQDMSHEARLMLAPNRHGIFILRRRNESGDSRRPHDCARESEVQQLSDDQRRLIVVIVYMSEERLNRK